MSPMAVSWIVFGCTFGGALLGRYLRTVLPEHHLNDESKDLVKLCMGVVATMSAQRGDCANALVDVPAVE